MSAKYTKLYEVLGFEVDALLSAQSLTHDMLKKQYRKMAMKWHPDKNENSPESVEMMAKLSHAWAILGDQEKRAKYDTSGIGEEGLEATALNLVGIEMLQELLDALMWQRSKGSPFEALFGGGNSGRPTLRDWSEKDLIKEAKSALIKMRDEVKGNLTTFQADLNKLKAFAARIKWDPEKAVDGGEAVNQRAGHQQGRTFNPLHGMVSSHIMRLERGLSEGNQKLLEIEACEDMLQYYTFDFTPPAPVSALEGRFHAGGLVGKSARIHIFDDYAFEEPAGKHTAGFGEDVSNNPDLWPTWMQAEYANHTRSSVTKPKSPREFYMEMVNKMAEDIGFGEAKTEEPPPPRYEYRGRPEDFGPSHRKRGKDGRGRF